MKKTYTLYPATAEDILLLPAIQLKAATRFPVDIFPEPWRSTYTVPQELVNEAYRNNNIWVAKDKAGNLAGYAILRDFNGEAVLEQVDVLPEHGKQGLGRALVEKIIIAAKQQGYDNIYLTTFEDIPWNCPFYKKIGFKVVKDKELPAVLRENIEQERSIIKGRVPMQLELN